MDTDHEFIVGVINDIENAKLAVKSGLKPEHISNDFYKNVYGTICDLVNNKLEVNNDTIKAHFESQIQNSTELTVSQKVMFASKLSRLFESETDSFKFSLNDLLSKRKRSEIERLFQKSIDEYSASSDLNILIDLSSQVKRFANENSDEVEMYDFFSSEDVNKRRADRIRLVTDTSLSLKMPDRLNIFGASITRGFAPQTITAFAAETGVGKSILLSNMVEAAVGPQNKLDTLVIIAENRYIEFATRLEAIMRDKKHSSFYDNVHDEDDEDGFFKDPNKFGKLKVVKESPGTFDADKIESIILRIREDEGWTPKVLVIDSPDHMKSVATFKEKWQEKGSVYWELKALTDTYDLITLTSLPFKPGHTKQGGKKEQSGAEGAAGSYDIARIIDNMFILYTPTQEDLHNKRRVGRWGKVRDYDLDPKLVAIQILPSLRMQDYSDINTPDKGKDFAKQVWGIDINDDNEVTTGNDKDGYQIQNVQTYILNRTKRKFQEPKSEEEN